MDAVLRILVLHYCDVSWDISSIESTYYGFHADCRLNRPSVVEQRIFGFCRSIFRRIGLLSLARPDTSKRKVCAVKRNSAHSHDGDGRILSRLCHFWHLRHYLRVRFSISAASRLRTLGRSLLRHLHLRVAHPANSISTARAGSDMVLERSPLLTVCARTCLHFLAPGRASGSATQNIHTKGSLISRSKSTASGQR